MVFTTFCSNIYALLVLNHLQFLCFCFVCTVLQNNNVLVLLRISFQGLEVLEWCWSTLHVQHEPTKRHVDFQIETFEYVATLDTSNNWIGLHCDWMALRKPQTPSGLMPSILSIVFAQIIASTNQHNPTRKTTATPNKKNRTCRTEYGNNPRYALNHTHYNSFTPFVKRF